MAPPGGDPFNIGETWAKTEKDRGLVCFICLSDISAGEARPGYFAATTGYERLVTVVAATDGENIKTSAISAPKAPFSEDIFASRVAHECAHAFGLGDEYGPGTGVTLSGGGVGIPIFPNLQAKMVIATGTVLNPSLIKWLLPRAIKVGRVVVAPTLLSGQDFQLKLDPAVPQSVRRRRSRPHQGGAAQQERSIPAASIQSRAEIYFCGRCHAAKRAAIGSSAVPRQQVHPHVRERPAGTRAHPGGCPRARAHRDNEQPAECSVQRPGSPMRCRRQCAAIYAADDLPPLNFPQAPASMADVLGIYEGGGHIDCEEYRPAGRCKMRTADSKTVPFCHVCRYIMVDRVEALKLAELDQLFDPFFPF